MGRYVSNTATSAGVIGAASGPVTKQRCTIDVIATSCTWTVPSGITSATFEAWGGGGNGGVNCCCECSGMSGGTGGGYSVITISVTTGTAYTICAGTAPPGPYYCSNTPNGCHGCPSYVTGTGLSNFCADGGGGGTSGNNCAYGCKGACSCCGGQAWGYGATSATGLGLNGGFNWNMNWGNGSFCSMAMGGGAPLGGGASYNTGNSCTPYYTCGINGNFPGGGGSGATNCCCDCCGCSGAGAPGYVRITF